MIKVGKGTILWFRWFTVIRMKMQEANYGEDVILSRAECFLPSKQLL